jgi:hypothetical protein
MKGQKVPHCSQKRSQIMTATSQNLTSGVATWRSWQIAEPPAGAAVSRTLSHIVAQRQMVGAVRFELTSLERL